MLDNTVFHELIEAARLASSADNMQPWAFKKTSDGIAVYCAEKRKLPTDTNNMFTWVGIGCAIQNITEKAAELNLRTTVSYLTPALIGKAVALLSFEKAKVANYAPYIEKRKTNRETFNRELLMQKEIDVLRESVACFTAGIHHSISPYEFEKIARMDAGLSYIRLEYKPFYNELFDVLRFSRDELDTLGFGLDFGALGVPNGAVYLARMLKYTVVNKMVSKLGIGKLVSYDLARKLRASGAVFLLTSKTKSAMGYMEAGRAVQRLWLAATAKGLSVHPYGVLPQYLTKKETEPDTLLPRYCRKIEGYESDFFKIFPGALSEYPALLLRVGYARSGARNASVRLKREEIILE